MCSSQVFPLCVNSVKCYDASSLRNPVQDFYLRHLFPYERTNCITQKRAFPPCRVLCVFSFAQFKLFKLNCWTLKSQLVCESIERLFHSFAVVALSLSPHHISAVISCSWYTTTWAVPRWGRAAQRKKRSEDFSSENVKFQCRANKLLINWTETKSDSLNHVAWRRAERVGLNI